MYSDFVKCLHCAASGVIPTTRCKCVSDEHNTPGWNEYVKDAHSEAIYYRDAFKLWILSSKPRHGDVFQSMKQSRARFKFKLRQCKRDEARQRADILADDLHTTLFWSHVSKQNRRCIIPADKVGGATGRDSIASMWKNHYAKMFNCVDTLSDK